jgi:hypothetical protein
MARVFAYLMQNNVDMTDKAIFEDTSHTVKKALEKIYQVNPKKTGLLATGLQVSLKQLIS